MIEGIIEQSRTPYFFFKDLDEIEAQLAALEQTLRGEVALAGD
jgi:hypothetical protein